MSEPLEQRAQAILERAPNLMTVLSVAQACGLADALVFSGAVYQPVLNHLTGRASDFGLKDYDLAYFDAADLSYEAEDTVIKQVAKALAPDLRDLVEVRNQARVHLWFEQKFGEPYAPLGCSAQAMERFVSPLFAIGVGLDAAGRLKVVAPFGLEDLFALQIRPNPLRPARHFAAAAAKIQARWPELEICG